jgi:protein-disulfide isomerase/uncharacterized membrane protein
MKGNRLAVVVLLALAGAFLSGLLLFEHHGVSSAASAVHRLCGTGEESGCDLVSRSAYSSVFDLSLAAIGVIFYSALLLLLALGLASSSEAVREGASAAALLALGAALAIDLLLLGIQVFSIGAFCRVCLATYAVNVVAFFVLLPARAKPGALMTAAETRRALSVWALGAVVIATGVGVLDQVLAAAAEPGTKLLGEAEPAPSDPPPVVPAPIPAGAVAEPPAPEPEPSPTPPVAAASADELAKARAQLTSAQARIAELQETLDNPQKFQAYQEQKATEAFEREPRVELDLEGVPAKGPSGAPIQVVEFSDFLCPFCRQLAGAFGGFLPQSQGRVSVFFKHYPLDKDCNPVMTRTVHEGACEVALGGVCAEEQGKFWPYHDRIFQSPPQNPSVEDVVRIAAEAGLDGNALRQCLSSPAARSRLDRDLAEGKRLQVNATPTVFVNGKRLEQIGAFMKAIESESNRLGLPKTAPGNPSH